MTDDMPSMEELEKVAINVFRMTQKTLSEASLRGELSVAHHGPGVMSGLLRTTADYLVSIKAVQTPKDADQYAEWCKEQLIGFMNGHIEHHTESGTRAIDPY